MRKYSFRSWLLSVCLILASQAMGTTYTVTTNSDDGANTGSLRYCLLNAVNGDTINFNENLGTITVGSNMSYPYALPVLQGVTLNGAGNTISGNNTYNIFFAYTGSNAINNLTLQEGLGQGGNGASGGSGGGGGLGAGGALFVWSNATVSTSGVVFENNSVAGGNGGSGGDGFFSSPSGGGGGGLFGSNAGDTSFDSSGSGGGGLFSSHGGLVGFSGSGSGGGGLFGSSGGEVANFASGSGGGGVFGGNGVDSVPSTGGNGGFGTDGSSGDGAGGNRGMLDENGTDGGNGGAQVMGTFAGGGGGGGGGAGGDNSVMANGGLGGAGGTAELGGGGGGGYGGLADMGGLGGNGADGGSTQLGGGGGGGRGGSSGIESNGGNGGNGGSTLLGGGGGGGWGLGVGPGGDGGSSTFGGGGGGGGMGGVPGSGGSGGFGGGDGGNGSNPGGSGGGGSAFGGAVFVATNGTLNIVDGGFSGNTLGAPGTGSTPGTAEGSELYLMTTTTTTMNVTGTAIAIDGTIAGAGTLIKQGAGTLILNAANPLTGTTQVLQGVLNLAGSVAGNVIVSNQGTLGGNGTVGGDLTVNSGGSVAPGNSIGTLHVLGNYINNLGNYDVEINGAGLRDLIDVTGNATLSGGTVVVSSVDGTYSVNHAYTIVTAANVAGTYGGATILPINGVNPLLIQPVLSYDPNHVYITLQTSIDRGAHTCNQIVVAQQLDSIADPNANQTILLNAILGLPTADVATGLDSLSGQQYTTGGFTTEIVNRQFIRRLYDPLRSIITAESCENACCNPCCDTVFNAWLETGGGHTNVDSNSNVRSFNMSAYEVTAGGQATFCNEWVLGVAGAYEYDHLSFKSLGSGRNQTWLAGLYGLYRPSCYYLLTDFAYGYSTNTTHRSINLGTTHYRARGNPKISQFTFYGEIGVDWNVMCCDECFLIQPFAGIEAGATWHQRIVEHNGGEVGLVINKRDRTNVFSRIGLHLTANELPGCFSLSADLAWDKRLSNNRDSITAHFTEFGKDFVIDGARLGNNSFDWAVTLATDPLDCMQFYIEAAGEVWSRASTYNVLAGIKYTW